ncbi:MAG: alpha/beta hydrolase [Massilia sp.]
MRNRAKRGLIAFALVLLATAAVLYQAGTTLTSPHYQQAGVPDPALAAVSVRIPHESKSIAGWYAPALTHGHGAVLLLHGVHSSRRQMQARALFLHRLGYAVLLIDLPGHGESIGDYITFGAHEARGVSATLAWLRKTLPNEKIGVIGASLGAAATVLAKPGPQIDALVIEAMYPTIEEATANRLALHGGAAARVLAPLLLAQLPWRTGVQLDQLRPIDAIGQLSCPLFVMGGMQDRHTTPQETQRLFDAARVAKQLWLVQGATHVDLYDYAPEEYEQRVGAFLAAHLR